MLSHETTTFDEIPLAEVSNKWNCFDSVNKKLFELVSKQILLQFLVTLYQWNWFFSKNRSNRMMLSVWFLVFWQINHVKFNNKECAKKGFIFSLYILLAIYENVGVEQSMKRTMNKYWFFPSLFFSPYFSFVVIPFVLSVVDFFHVFQTHKMPFGIMKGKNE